eukprot:TRINITY_DN629_c0_g1_i1.p2 TRINITY_DN629_c0_g1~~TRINITY_DN629_c0_g1_i1.p2  ORF type:complete len:147 (-),score=44.78 TRINITY_DN629_c0_g1_i1:292-732(-)
MDGSNHRKDVSLPKATVHAIIKEMLPSDARIANDARDMLTECCVEFINLLSSEANEICSKEEKKTIAPEHVLKALTTLGFDEYISEVQAAYDDHKQETATTHRGHSRAKPNGGMTEEEAIAAQQKMFAEARARMAAQQQNDKKPSV